MKILRVKHELPDVDKTDLMLELVEPSVYDAVTSPRVLNTHVLFDELPEEVGVYFIDINFNQTIILVLTVN